MKQDHFFSFDLRIFPFIYFLEFLKRRDRKRKKKSKRGEHTRGENTQEG